MLRKFLRIHSGRVPPRAYQLFPCCSSTDSTIHIPQRIKRGPTDILQTLSCTVKKDPTAAHYKYHDDPFLIPMSNVGKRTFAMAQEAGRKAAKWIVNEHSEWFGHKLSDPPIQAFMPKPVYNEGSDVAEETLLKVINEGLVSDAVIIYDLLVKKGAELSDNTKQALLELISFYNAEDGIQDEFIEERWFRQSKKGKNVDTSTKTWKDNGLADALFKSISDPRPDSYSAIIQGMIKYGQVDRAWQLFEAAKEKGLTLDIGVYNSLLGSVNILKQGPELRWQLTRELLFEISEAKLKPTIGTLNAVLFTISVMGGNGTLQNVSETFAEFRSVGITPSLGSYYYVLQAFTRDRSLADKAGQVLREILNEISGKPFTIADPSDTNFFVKAMEVCRFHAQDIQLAREVDDLLHCNENYNLIGSSFEESVYYRHYFLLLCATETMDRVMVTYDLLVPHVYTPEPSVMLEIIRAADMSGELTLLPRLWTDMVLFDHTDRENLLAALLSALVKNEPAPGTTLNSTFSSIALEIWDKIENQPVNRTNLISWSGDMLSSVMILFSRNDDINLAGNVMRKLRQETSYLGEPSIDALCAYMDLCIGKRDFSQALDCLKYCKDNGRTELITMAKDLRSRLTITDDQAQQLADVLGGG